MEKLPLKVTIFSKTYNISYCDNPCDVDADKRTALFGEVDHWDNTIRILRKGRTRDEVIHTILHECVHIIQYQLKLDENCMNEHYIELFALGIVDMLKQNPFFVSICEEKK